jgi:thiol-disulfide isomerase/thioredoxin
MYFRLRFLLFLFTSFSTLFLSTLYAQTGYKISIQIEGLQDSLIYLANYNGDKQFIVDTAYLKKGNAYVFADKKPLLAGMYFLTTAEKVKLFDFVIDKSLEFTLSGKRDRIPASLSVKNSPENKVFFEYVNFLAGKQKEQARLLQLKKNYPAGSDSLNITEARINGLNAEVKKYIADLIEAHPGSFVSAFLTSMKEPDIPPAPQLSDGKTDSTFSYRYYKAHFWDNTNLNDDRLVRTPLLHSKVEQYLTRLTPPQPDSVIQAVDYLFSMAGDNIETFKYLMWYLTVKFESSEIMGYDAIFVHLVNKYYNDPKMSWMNKTVKENLEKRAAVLQPILIGKPAPEMILYDTLQRPVSLHKVNADYTLVYFWDPDCSHCKKETPLLKDFYTKNKDLLNLEVYAVCMDTSWKDMKNYIIRNQTSWINVNGFYSITEDFREIYDVHSSPVMYLLDKNKVIVAKRVLTEQMSSILGIRTKKTIIK